jgi:hypothetical protein
VKNWHDSVNNWSDSVNTSREEAAASIYWMDNYRWSESTACRLLGK